MGVLLLEAEVAIVSLPQVTLIILNRATYRRQTSSLAPVIHHLCNNFFLFHCLVDFIIKLSLLPLTNLVYHVVSVLFLFG